MTITLRVDDSGEMVVDTERFKLGVDQYGPNLEWLPPTGAPDADIFKAHVAFDWYDREAGIEDGPKSMQALVFDGGQDDAPAVAVRFNEDGTIREVVLRRNLHGSGLVKWE